MDAEGAHVSTSTPTSTSTSAENENENENGNGKSTPTASNAKWPRPYYAVIFTSRRRAADARGLSSPPVPVDSTTSTYADTAQAMFALAQTQPGFLGVDSHHTVHADGSVAAVTVSYWTDQASIRAWRAVEEHAAARRRGREEWYRAWNVRVAKVEREYGKGWMDGDEDGDRETEEKMER